LTLNIGESYSIILSFYEQPREKDWPYVTILFIDNFNSTPIKEENPQLRSLLLNHSYVELVF